MTDIPDILDSFFILLLGLPDSDVVLPILGIGGVLLVPIVVARQAVQPLVLLMLELFLPLVSGGVSKDWLGGVLALTWALPDLLGYGLGIFLLPVDDDDDDLDILSSSPDNVDDGAGDALGQFMMVPGIVDNDDSKS